MVRLSILCLLLGCSGSFWATAPIVVSGADAGPADAQQEAVDCDIVLSGRLQSEHDGEALAYANIFSPTLNRGVQADEAGNFQLTDLCPGDLTLRFTHLGCDAEEVSISLRRDTQLVVFLHHHDNFVETVTVSAKAKADYSQRQDQLATAELASSLERITGVSSLRTGTAAAKPVYDGLFGNRLSIQNNGVAQSGQQWGNDHAPEIDPWVAAYVRVVEGVEALKYAGSTVAATVLIEPAPLREQDGPSGKVAYGFRSNGRGHTLNARLTQGGKTSYRISATGKFAGDQRTPDYFLTNTGRREANAALQLARFHNERWTSRMYYSVFNANIGVLRGSHIGNLTDLNAAIGRDRPFFTRDTFSYALASPRQAVTHHLLKAETEFRPDEANRFTLRYGGQLNDRKEFDVRRGDDNRAAMSLQQWSHLIETAWHRELGPDQHLDANLQYDFILNDNQPGTGILPLIPDYNSNRLSGYLAYHKESERFQYHAGLRFDRQFYEAITITRTPPRRIERFEHVFNTLGASLEGRWQVSTTTSLRSGLTFRQRAPQINEMYSNGLHQGVSGIEEGDQNLVPETSLKLTAGLAHNKGPLSLNATVFLQPIQDYIFLEPQDSFRLTIRGAFPLFLYRSGDALLYGTNVQAFYQAGEHWELDGRLAIVRGTNRSEREPLVFMPSDNLRLGVHYNTDNDWKLSLEGFLVARQNRLEEEQDFLDTPPGYQLVDLSVGRVWTLPRNRSLNLRVAAQNVLDVRYRDYLDRQRYFADAPGRNVEFRVSYGW